MKQARRVAMQWEETVVDYPSQEKAQADIATMTKSNWTVKDEFPNAQVLPEGVDKFYTVWYRRDIKA